MFVQHELNHHVVNVCHLEAQVDNSLELCLRRCTSTQKMGDIHGTIHYYLGTDLCEPYCPLLLV